MSNGLYNGLENGLNSGLYNGSLDGSKVGMFENETIIKYDTDALKFLNLPEMLNLKINERLAVNKMVVRLKNLNLWNQMYAIYPFIGGTSETCKYNLKTPVNSNSAYRLVFFGNPTFDKIGMKGDSVGAYANTYFNPLWPNYPFFSIGIYLALNLDESGAHMGTINSSNAGYTISARNSNVYYAQAWEEIASTTASNTDSKGFYIVTRTSSTSAKSYKNGLLFMSHANQSGNYGVTYDILIGCRNNDGTPLYFNSNKTGFAFIGNGLNDVDSINLNNIVNEYLRATGKWN